MYVYRRESIKIKILILDFRFSFENLYHFNVLYPKMIIINKHICIKIFESNFFIIFYMYLINSLYI